jgi:hypothetical protein
MSGQIHRAATPMNLGKLSFKLKEEARLLNRRRRDGGRFSKKFPSFSKEGCAESAGVVENFPNSKSLCVDQTTSSLRAPLLSTEGKLWFLGEDFLKFNLFLLECLF